MAKARRTTHRSVAGKKLYAVRDAKGRFKDIQTYERAHGADTSISLARPVQMSAGSSGNDALDLRRPPRRANATSRLASGRSSWSASSRPSSWPWPGLLLARTS